MRFKLLLFTLLCSLAAIMPAKAETLTVYDGTVESYYAPAYIFYWEQYTRSECVIPASALTEMIGCPITALTFYTNQTSALTTKDEAYFYLKEVSYTSISSYETKENSTIVYQGKLSITADGKTSITLSSPFTYHGGNLLIGSENVSKAGYNSVKFKGQTVSGACIAGHNSSSVSSVSAGQQNFIPKTTFTYEPASDYPKPTNVAVDDITARSAKVTWDGDANAESFNLRYRPLSTLSWDFEDQGQFDEWTKVDADGDGFNWSYETAGYTTHSGSGLVVSASYDNDTGTALTPNNWLISPQVTLGGVLKLWAAGQDSNGYHNEVFGVYVCTGDPSNMNNFVQVGADVTTAHEFNEYEYDLSAFNGTGYIAIVHHNITDQFVLNVDDISYSLAGDWITVNGVTSPYTINGLNPQTIYEVQVQAVYSDDSSDWTNSENFTTADGLDVPTNLAVSEITHNSAVATWEGTQDSYNLRYRTPAKADVLFTESFEGTFPGAWTLVDSDGDGNNWTQFNPMNFSEGGFPAYDGQYGAMSRSWLSSGALTPDNWLISPEIENLGGTLRYYVVDDGSNYPETYQVYVSTAEGTDISNFVAVSEKMQSPNSAEWVEVTIDLSAYAGQSGRIAFRNYDCTDKDFMIIDAIGIYANEVPAGEWVTIPNVTSPYTIEGLDPETEYEVQVQGILDNGTTNWTESVIFTTLEAPVEATLAELCENGENGTIYTISNTNGLLGVYQQGNSIWFKDENGEAIDFQVPGASDLDYTVVDENNESTNEKSFDQSNWIEVVFPSEVDYTEVYVKNLTGTFSMENGNPKLILTKTVAADDVTDANAYVPNPYTAANFVGSQQGYFFSMPKAQEYAKILWAVWDGTKMNMPSNSYGFTGSFTISEGMNSYDLSSLEPGEAYNFNAVIRKVSGSKGAGDTYEVYPTNLNGDVPTGINTIVWNGNGKVVGVEYVNSLGMTSKTPFQGVNIVVTRYSNGATTTVKKIFK